MASVTLRPNATLRQGFGPANPHIALSDSVDTTASQSDQPAGWYITSNPVVAFTDATTAIPPGRQIISVTPVVRGARANGLANGFGAFQVSFEYYTLGPHDIFDILDGPVGSSAYVTVTGTTRTSAYRYSGGGSWGAWTYALVDDLTVCIGSQSGATQTGADVSDVWLNVVYSDLPAAPTAVTPASGATVTVPNPALGGTMSAIATGQSQKMEWQFATDAGFTANVKTVTEASGDLRASGATTESPTIANLSLTNGTWYIRGRAIDQYGVAGPYNTAVTFTVNVPALSVPTTITPAAAATVTTMTPTLGATLVVDAAGRQQKAEFQLATDSGFTVNVRGVVELDADYRASGATTEVLPTGSKITSDLGTTWYLRARSVGNDGTTSAWSAGQSFTLAMAAPPTPTAVTPADGSTVTTNTPTLGATLSAATESRTVKAEWQLATDSGFTANVRTITEGAGDLRASGATTEVIPGGSKLFQTLWYMRCRAIDQYGQAGSYSATQTLTVAHLPTASPTSPIADTTVLYQSTTFNWNFSDPAAGDTQTAYQLIVERNDTGAVVFDTAKTASTTGSRVLTTANMGSLKDVKLRWKVRVWDADDVAGNYSAYQLFTLSDVPTVTITAPTAGQQITTGQPTVTWSNDGATVQAQRQLVFRRTSDNVIVHDSGVQNSSSTTYTPPQTILENLTNYSVTVTVTDTVGMVGSAVRSFSTLYQVPATVTFTVNASGYEDLGYVVIDWSAMIADGFFVDWRVYRKLTTGSTWELIYTTTNQSITNYHDWTATTGDTWQYAVTQTAGRSGTILESVIAASAGYLMVGSHYWLIDPMNELNNVRLSQVVSDEYSDDYEETELIIIGRGRKVNQGTRYGYTGTLACQLRDDSTSTARQKRMKLQIIKDARASYYLRNPFGDVLQISLGNLQLSRVAGVGTNEYVDVTIPYKEVF